MMMVCGQMRGNLQQLHYHADVPDVAGQQQDVSGGAADSAKDVGKMLLMVYSAISTP